MPLRFDVAAQDVEVEDVVRDVWDCTVAGNPWSEHELALMESL